MIAFLFTTVYVLSSNTGTEHTRSDVENVSASAKRDSPEAGENGTPGETDKGIKAAFRKTARSLLHDRQARHIFWLAFYTAVILSNTLFNRFIWRHPLAFILEGWGFFYIEKSPAGGWQIIPGTFDVRAAENIVMMMPEVWLAILAFPAWFRKKGCIFGSFIIAGGMSLMIEILQLVFFMGTFQISDLVYNTGGGVAAGMIGGIFVHAIPAVRGRKKETEKGNIKENNKRQKKR